MHIRNINPFASGEHTKQNTFQIIIQIIRYNETCEEALLNPKETTAVSYMFSKYGSVFKIFSHIADHEYTQVVNGLI